MRLRVAVAGRPAAESVRNEYVAALQPDLREQLLEQLARAPHERQPLLVLARTGGLADEHEVGVGVAGSEDDRFARLGELGAALAGSRPREQLLEGLAPLGGGRRMRNCDHCRRW